jgi:butyrate kinase
MDAVMAQTLSISLDEIERIDRMIATAEVRRNAILREVDRHRTRAQAQARRPLRAEPARRKTRTATG